MFAEQEQFRSSLMKLSPEEIIKRSYEYVCREDILLALEYNSLTCRQAQALLELSSPLAEVFARWEHTKTGYMQDVWKTLKRYADETVHKNECLSFGECR